jgi:hypothetical protein
LACRPCFPLKLLLKESASMRESCELLALKEQV